VGIRSVSCSNPARYKKRLWGHFLLPPPLTILPVRRLPSRRSAGAGDAENNKRGAVRADGVGRGRRSSDPSALSPLLSSGVVACRVAISSFVNCATPNPVRCLRFASRFHGAPLCVQKKPGAICCKIGSYFVLSVSIYCCCCCWSWVVFWFCCYCCCWGFFAVFLCAHTHSFIVVILLVWFRLFAVSFRIDKVFRQCSLCGSQGLMTARGSRGRRGWLLLLVGISGLRFSWLWYTQWTAFFKFRKTLVVVVFECTLCR
jgi:hypothetical protein